MVQIIDLCSWAIGIILVLASCALSRRHRIAGLSMYLAGVLLLVADVVIKMVEGRPTASNFYLFILTLVLLVYCAVIALTICEIFDTIHENEPGDEFFEDC